ncbi:MAG: hypothetical protein J6E41_02475 [Lachnospiraceae bacterium]|nr:hypothetical protein [Lachnospiraceae bacterium]
MDKHMEDAGKLNALRKGQQQAPETVSGSQSRSGNRKAMMETCAGKREQASLTGLRNRKAMMETCADKQGQACLTGLSSRKAMLRTGLLTAIAVMLVMSAAMGSAWAYFTTYATAKGGLVLSFGHQETVDEDFSSWEKVIDLGSEADSKPVYIRARAFSAEYPVTYSGQNWQQSGDWMYYQQIFEPGKKLSESGDELKVRIDGVPVSKEEGLKDGKTFNVIVVYESTEIQYDENGEPLSAENADWERALETTRTITQGGE